MCITGLGTGIFISPNNSALMGRAPRERQGIAAGMLATARNAGMALGVGLAGAVLTTVLAQGRGQTPADAARLGLFAAAVARGLHVATIAAALGGLVSLIRRPEPNSKHASVLTVAVSCSTIGGVGFSTGDTIMATVEPTPAPATAPPAPMVGLLPRLFRACCRQSGRLRIF